MDDQDPYGFGLRVVGLQLQGDQQNQVPVQLCARVLWISPGGPAFRAGVKVGDKVMQKGVIEALRYVTRLGIVMDPGQICLTRVRSDFSPSDKKKYLQDGPKST